MNSIFIKLSLRKLLKSKVYSITNLMGLTVGFTAFILIALFIHHELSWDKNHENYTRIYRVQRQLTNATQVIAGTDISPHSRAITAQMIEGKFPEFKKMSVIREINSAFLATNTEDMVHEKEGLHADTCFFDIFTYTFIEGNPKTALNQPYAIVLSETLAQKLFKKTDVMGKTVVFEKKYPLIVTGVYTDLPYNSSLRPSFIISFSSLKPIQNIERSDLWTGDCMTYALLKPGTSKTVAEAKIRNLFEDYEDIKYEKLQLCPLSKVYLNFNNRNDYLIVLKLFGLIGLFILLMSGFNYINLSLAQASMRGKEVAVKKVMGSRKYAVVVQFLTETIGISIVALFFAFVLSKLFLPVFNNVVDKHIVFNLSDNWGLLLILLLVSVVTGLLSGLYPAMFMASNKIVSLFKGNFFSGQHDTFGLKKTLVTFQFAISLFLIILTASFSMQIKHIANKDLGFDQEGLLYSVINISENQVQFGQFRDRLAQHPEIVDVSISKNFPFVGLGGGMTNWEGGDPNEKITCRFNRVSYNYLSVLNTPLVAGRTFSPDFGGDEDHSCIINEAAAKCFGWDNPIGKRINDNRLTVVGVVRDFIYHDMHNPIEPNVLTLAPNSILGNWTFAFRIHSTNLATAKDIITTELSSAFPNDAFEISDFTTAFNNENSFRIYHSVNKSLVFFTVLNVMLAIMGMFGLVSFSVARRTKEIGIRKINGCSVFGIFNLLNSEYYLLVVSAIVLAFPGAWFAYMSLPSANKLPVQTWLFVLCAITLLLIVLISTCYQTIKAAKQNPVESLRYE
ncbi:MAG: ABC transporter permease [Prolixibacteraceae bacterium]|nr:ABC transporter permease [Prolixibacteraceae bacterium]